VLLLLKVFVVGEVEIGEVEKGECWRGGVRARGSWVGSTSLAVLEAGTPKGRPDGRLDETRSILLCVCVCVCGMW